MQFNNTSLVIEQDNYGTKIEMFTSLKVQIILLQNLLRNLTLKIFLFGSTNIAKDNDKENYYYSIIEKASGVSTITTPEIV